MAHLSGPLVSCNASCLCNGTYVGPDVLFGLVRFLDFGQIPGPRKHFVKRRPSFAVQVDPCTVF